MSPSSFQSSLAEPLSLSGGTTRDTDSSVSAIANTASLKLIARANSSLPRS